MTDRILKQKEEAKILPEHSLSVPLSANKHVNKGRAKIQNALCNQLKKALERDRVYGS